MARVVAELVVVPLGTGSPSISSWVAEIEEALKAFPLKIKLTPMGTVLEGELGVVLQALQAAHEVPFSKGALRVATHLRIDERRDKNLTMEGKIRSVETKML